MESLSKSLWRDAPPAHFIFRIESFSTLSSSSFEKFETSVFVAGGCKWKLALYPNGNTSQGVNDHLSLYLVSVDKSSLDLKKKILTSFALLVFDHARDKYFAVQEVARLDENKSEIGFDKFLPLKIFKDPSNGYLINDDCVFGAEVYLNINKPKRQCLSMLTSKPPPFKFTWMVNKFPGIKYNYCRSETFTTRGHDWYMALYPKGIFDAEGSLSLYLNLVDPGTLKVYVEFKLRIVDQVNKRHKINEYIDCFSKVALTSHGSSAFLPLADLNESTGYLVNDTCILEAEIIVLGSSKDSD